MATETTSNLGLVIEDGLTSTAKSNLRKIDTLGTVYRTSAAGDSLIQSANDIQFLPNASEVGGTGSGGSILAGKPGQRLTDFTVYGPLSLDDNSSLYKLSLIYAPTTPTANQTLTVRTNDASLTLSVEGNLTFSNYDLTFTQSAASSLTLPAGTETLLGRDTTDTVTNKSIDSDNNTITNIVNDDIKATAAIDYSKLNLALSIVNADINAGAGIAGTKIDTNFGGLDLTTSGNVVFSAGNSTTLSGAASPSVPVIVNLPPDNGAANYVLTTDGAGNTTWDPAGGGTVNSVGLTTSSSIFTITGSPITTTGDIDITVDDQIANSVYAGPGSGSPAAPDFRQLVATDIPVIDHTKISDFDAGVFDILDANPTAEIVMAYDDAGTFSATLETTTVTAAEYGDAATSATFTVDTKGRLTAASESAIAITASQVTDFNEAAQDALDLAFTDSEVVWTYNDVANTHTADLATTTVTAASYGSASAVPTYTVDTKGRLTAAADVNIAITASQVTDFNEAAQDALDLAFTDSTNIEWTYDDGLNTHTADLSNTTATVGSYGSATAVSTFTVDAKGRLTASGSTAIAIPHTQITDFDTEVNTLIDASTAKTTWVTGDGTTKVFNHALSSTDILVELFDIDSGETIFPDTVVRTDADNLTMTSSSAPTGSGWRILVRKV